MATFTIHYSTATEWGTFTLTPLTDHDIDADEVMDAFIAEGGDPATVDAITEDE